MRLEKELLIAALDFVIGWFARNAAVWERGI